MAFALAIHKLFSTPDHCALSYYNGGTVDQLAHDIDCNYGTGVQEALIQCIFNLHYGTPVIISPVANTECLRTPSVEELINIASAGMRAETKAQEWLPLMDFSPIEEMAEILIDKGREFFDNVLSSFKEAGVNIKDPLEMILTLKRFNPNKFEQSFHPSINEFGEFKPYVQSQLGTMTQQLREEIVCELKRTGFNVSGKKIVCVSTDCHTYGLYLALGVYEDLGATVVSGGVDVEAPEALDLAEEEGADAICVSTHCGQSLAFAQRITNLLTQRRSKIKVVMGGMLNALLPGEKLPTEVVDLINKTAVFADNDFAEQINYINR